MQFFGVGRDWILKVLSSLFFLRFFVYGKRESGDKRIKGFAVVFFTFSAHHERPSLWRPSVENLALSMENSRVKATKESTSSSSNRFPYFISDNVIDESQELFVR